MSPPDHRNAGRAWWWHLAVAALVAPFYLGLYVITAIGAAFDRPGR
ncbi:hypothetical protein [Sphingomonas rubra]|uniref:Uncharacterized protein n=1 Tax=Sphingomonas rubra TaxID=634430 RepID=A0A1I5RAJ1_9SPHN|nr:hypothetical protein [Sphingomonas rubra]SFP55574.1 hypothetical protein SAMN04488241_103125 [Sphingomonas rubra]